MKRNVNLRAVKVVIFSVFCGISLIACRCDLPEDDHNKKEQQTDSVADTQFR